MPDTMERPKTARIVKTRYSAAQGENDWAVVASQGKRRLVLMTGLSRSQASKTAATMTGSRSCAHDRVIHQRNRTRCVACGHIHIIDLSLWITVRI